MWLRLQKVSIWIICMTIGVSATITLVSYTWNYWNFSRWSITLLGLPMAVICTMLAYACYRFAWRRIAIYRTWVKALLAGLGFLTGICVAAFLLPPSLPTVHPLEIRATGKLDLFSETYQNKPIVLPTAANLSNLSRIETLAFRILPIASVFFWSFTSWLAIVVLGSVIWNWYQRISGAPSKQKAAVEHIGFYLLGLAVTTSLLNFWDAFWELPRSTKLLILFVIGLAVANTLSVFFQKWLKPKLAVYSPRSQLVWSIASLLIALYLVLVLPIGLIKLPWSHQLEIIATGEKNELSNGSEVWVIDVRKSDGTKISLDQFQFQPGWTVKDGLPVSYKDQPTSLIWSGRTRQDLEINLVSHPWSGEVILRLDKQERKIDLYSDSSGNEKIVVKYDPIAEQSWLRVLVNFWVYIALVVAIALLTLAVSIYLVNRPDPLGMSFVSQWEWVGYSLVMMIIWVFNWLVFFPGIMTSDSIDQWSQVLSGNYNDAHPAFHSWTIWLFSRLWPTPAVVGLAQIIALGGLAGYIFYFLRKTGVPKLAVVLGVIFFAISIPNSAMVITIWKDIPFAITFLGLNVVWLKIIATDGQWLRSKINLGVFSLLLVLLALFRHNGAPVVLFSMVPLIILRRQDRYRLIFVSGIFLGLVYFVRGPVYQWANVQRATSYFESNYELRHIAAHLDHNTSITVKQQNLLNAIRPIYPDRQWSYDCDNQGAIIRDETVNWKVIAQNRGEIRSIFISTLLHNPRVNLEHLLCSSTIVWQLYNKSTILRTASTLKILPNKLGLETQSKIPGFYDEFNKLYLKENYSDFIWLIIWRPAIYFYLFLFGVAILIVRTKRMDWLALYFPVIGVALSLFLVIPAPSFRYMYPIYLASLALWPLLFFSKKTLIQDQN